MTRELVVDRSESQLELTPPPAKEPSIGSILARAVEQNMPVESLERIVGLYERMQANAAKAAFNAAMAAFQSECPVIAKTSIASFVTKSGTHASYRYAELDEIADTIRECCRKHRLSYSWDCSNNNGVLACICTVRHADGHQSTATFTIPVDGSVLMSSAQKHAATLTYAKRQSLVLAFGLVTGDVDDDGAIHETRGSPRISERDLANMDAMIAGDGVDRAAFLKFFGIDKLADMPASRVASAFKLLEDRRRKAK